MKTICIYCLSLINVTIPPFVTSIEFYALYNCAINEVIIPSSGVSSDNKIFSHWNVLADFDIFYSVTSIGGFAFSECCELKEVEITSSIKSIEQKKAFFNDINNKNYKNTFDITHDYLGLHFFIYKQSD